MEENKGIFGKIKALINRIFNRTKALPPPSQEKEYISIENNGFKEQYDVRESINKSNIQQQSKEIESSEIDNGEPLIETLIRMVENRNISEQDIQEIIDKFSDFSFLKNLENYNFYTNAIVDKDSPKNSYACYLAKDGELKEEKKLPICSVGNKEQAEIIEETLNSLKNITDENKRKEMLEDIINNGFKLNDENDRFRPTNDFHLNQLLEKLLNEKSNKITIEMDYLYKEDPKGLMIVKSAKKINRDEQQRRREERENKINYENLIKDSILQNKKIDISNMSEGQKELLKRSYMNMIRDIDKSAEYLDFAIECMSKYPEYERILGYYNKIQEDYEKYKNNSVMKVGVLARQKDAIRVILNSLKDLIRKNLDMISDKEVLENEK